MSEATIFSIFGVDFWYDRSWGTGSDLLDEESGIGSAIEAQNTIAVVGPVFQNAKVFTIDSLESSALEFIFIFETGIVFLQCFAVFLVLNLSDPVSSSDSNFGSLFVLSTQPLVTLRVPVSFFFISKTGP